MTQSIQCRCGCLKGTLQHMKDINRCQCYCTDCQAFAHFLQRESAILDASGGSDIIQTVPKLVAFTEGIDQLACIRLTPKGLLRWYAACCNTAIANTPANFQLSFVGLVADCLAGEQNSLNDAFGPVRMRVFTRHAKGKPKPKTTGLPGGAFRAGRMIVKSRLNGDYRENPFFSATGAPIVTPTVLNEQKLRDIKRQL